MSEYANDLQFIQTLSSESSLPNRFSPDALTDWAKRSCSYLDEGHSGPDIGQALVGQHGFTWDEAALFLGSAVAAYCPKHEHDIGA